MSNKLKYPDSFTKIDEFGFTDNAITKYVNEVYDCLIKEENDTTVIRELDGGDTRVYGTKYHGEIQIDVYRSIERYTENKFVNTNQPTDEKDNIITKIISFIINILKRGK